MLLEQLFLQPGHIGQVIMAIDEFTGISISSDEFKLSIAKEIVTCVSQMDFVEILDCQVRKDEAETIIIRVEVSLPQRKKADIRMYEDIGIVVLNRRDCVPEVFALRSDFPDDLAHTNNTEKPYPVSLCLFEESADEILLRWSSRAFVEEIRNWLSETASGQLHKEDQPVEPFLSSSSGIILLPHKYLTEEYPPGVLFVREHPEKGVYIGKFTKGLEDSIPHFSMPINIKEQVHGKINYTPKNLFELCLLLEDKGFNFVHYLSDGLKGISTILNDNPELREYRTLIILRVPIIRKADKEPENFNLFVFKIDGNIFNIGEALDLWQIHKDINNEIAICFNSVTNPKNLEPFKIQMLNPHLSLSRSLAAWLNGISINESKISLIGLGALGSQVYNNLSRMGFGKWTLVDDDLLFPHNLSRHALNSVFIGSSKSISISAYSNSLILDEADFSKPLPVNILRTNAKQRLIIGDADIIVDMSTSLAVARFLANDFESTAKRASFFLNPRGDSLIILAEDKDRDFRLDCLEMQYYRLLCSEEDLRNHLQFDEQRIRYARGCRDITNQINQENVSLLSAISSKKLRTIATNNSPCITIWNIVKDNLETKHLDYPVNRWITQKKGEWSLYIDTWVIEKIMNHRHSRLPNETGGILIGSFDNRRKIAYIADTILSPADSKEYPTAYIRGIEGVAEKIIDIKARTNNGIYYIGEWHSHPDFAELSPSDDDKQLLNWLKKYMEKQGYPALILIAGNGKDFNCIIQ